MQALFAASSLLTGEGRAGSRYAAQTRVFPGRATGNDGMTRGGEKRDRTVTKTVTNPPGQAEAVVTLLGCF